MRADSESRETTVGTTDRYERLRPGDLVSHFDSVTLHGRKVPYEELWQHRNFVLLVVPAELRTAASSYLAELENRLSDLKPSDTSLVLSHQPIKSVPMSSLVIADRWGEVVHIADLGSDPTGWLSIDDVIEWVEFIRARCPECPP